MIHSMQTIETTEDREGKEIKLGDIVMIDESVLEKKDETSGRINRIEKLGNLTLAYLYHRKGGGKMDITPFNVKHLTKIT